MPADPQIWPCPHCGTTGEFDRHACTQVDLALAHWCGTERAEIVIHCTCQCTMHEVFYFNGNDAEYSTGFRCPNCYRQMSHEDALRLVNKWGEALTAFGAQIQGAARALAAREEGR